MVLVVVYGAHGDDASTCGDDGDGGFAEPGDASSCVGDDSDYDGFTVKCCSGNLPQSSVRPLKDRRLRVVDCGRERMDATHAVGELLILRVSEAVTHMTRFKSITACSTESSAWAWY